MSTLIRCNQCITTASESDQGWHTVIVNGPIPNWPMVYHLCSPGDEGGTVNNIAWLDKATIGRLREYVEPDFTMCDNLNCKDCSERRELMALIDAAVAQQSLEPPPAVRIDLLEAVATAARAMPDQVGWFTEAEVFCAGCETFTLTMWERGGAQWPEVVRHTDDCPWVALRDALEAIAIIDAVRSGVTG